MAPRRTFDQFRGLPGARGDTVRYCETPASGTGGIRTPGPCEPPAFKAGAFVRSATVPSVEASDLDDADPDDDAALGRRRCPRYTAGLPGRGAREAEWGALLRR